MKSQRISLSSPKIMPDEMFYYYEYCNSRLSVCMGKIPLKDTHGYLVCFRIAVCLGCLHKHECNTAAVLLILCMLVSVKWSHGNLLPNFLCATGRRLMMKRELVWE